MKYNSSFQQKKKGPPVNGSPDIPLQTELLAFAYHVLNSTLQFFIRTCHTQALGWHGTFALDRNREHGVNTGGDENRYERMDGGFHLRVRQGFQDIAARNPKRCVLIDASRPLGEVTSKICAAVSRKFGLR